MERTPETDLCPCRSGRRYEDCCLAKDYERSQLNKARISNEELQRILREKHFDSLERLQEFVRHHTEQQNRKPQSDFFGLSPDQVHRMIYFPFTRTSDIVHFASDLPAESFVAVPIVRDIMKFLSAFFREGTQKATEKGNLPRKFAEKLFEEIDTSPWKGIIKFRSEVDSWAVYSLRHILALGRWIKKERGDFRLTRNGKDAVVNGFSNQHFLKLFQTYTLKFNWPWQDRYPDFWIIQSGFLFSLFILHKKARAWVKEYSLIPYFIRAFPSILREAEGELKEYYRTILHCYSLRFMNRFCAYFGLIETQEKSVGPFRYELILRTSGLFHQFLSWMI